MASPWWGMTLHQIDNRAIWLDHMADKLEATGETYTVGAAALKSRNLRTLAAAFRQEARRRRARNAGISMKGS